MPNQFFGIIPYGSTDSSVILNCSMTSLSEITSKGGAEVTANANTYDSTLGFKPNATNGGIKFTTIAGYQSLNFAGQMSMDVETRGIAITNAVAPSSGVDWASNTIFFTMRVVAGGTTPANMFRWYQDASERPQIGQVIATVAGGGTSPGTAVTCEITSTGKNAYTTVTISWCGGTYDIYLDGALLYTGNRAGLPTTDIAERLDFMSGANTTFGAPVSIYCRNVVVSTRPVMTSVRHGFNKIGIIGHSFATRFKSTNTANLSTDSWRDETGARALSAALLDQGSGAGLPTDYSTVWDGPGYEIRHAATNHISSLIPAAVAANCSAYVYLGGTNDVINANWSTNRATVLTDLKQDITDLLAAPNAKLLILHNVTSLAANTSQFGNEANVLEINTDMATLPLWWNTTNPTRAGQVVVLDAYSFFGKSNPPTELFQGSLRGTYADAHPSAVGIPLMGVLTAQALLAGMNS